MLRLLLFPAVCTASAYFSTSGNQIVDSTGAPFRLTGLNWHGGESHRCVLEGLDTRSYKSLLDEVKALGFNALRLPYSNECITASVNTGVNYLLNPDLVDRTALQVWDQIVAYCTIIDLKVMFDRHSMRSDNYKNEELWYSDEYPGE